MNADEKSDKVVIPKKQSNKEGVPSAETVEERTLPKRNTCQPTADRTQSRGTALCGLARVRQAVRRKKDVQFTALLHHVSLKR
jgi:hypothetical protein